MCTHPPSYLSTNNINLSTEYEKLRLYGQFPSAPAPLPLAVYKTARQQQEEERAHIEAEEERYVGGDGEGGTHVNIECDDNSRRHTTLKHVPFFLLNLSRVERQRRQRRAALHKRHPEWSDTDEVSVCVYMYVCVCGCMHTCMYVRMHACMYIY